MGGRSSINYQKYKRTIKSVEGYSSSPKFNTAVLDASPKQISYLQSLIDYTELLGLDTSGLLNGKEIKQPTSTLTVNTLVNDIHKLLREHGIMNRPKVVFTNMCKAKDTGKRIKYKTTHRYCAPVGYEFLYEISYEHVIPKLATNEERENLAS